MLTAVLLPKPTGSRPKPEQRSRRPSILCSAARPRRSRQWQSYRPFKPRYRTTCRFPAVSRNIATLTIALPLSAEPLPTEGPIFREGRPPEEEIRARVTETF